MNGTVLTQIVPTFAPKVNALGDYALVLAQELRQQFGLQTQFVVGDPAWSGAEQVEGFLVRHLTARSPQALVSQLADQPTALHYEGYGYAQRGYPRWLVQGLQQWHQAHDAQLRRTSPLLTYFHEVYPYDHGPPWTSSFWLGPLQRRLAGQLIRLSDTLLTSKTSYGQLLSEIHPTAAQKTTILPVCSNVGEPQWHPAWPHRSRRLVVFGHPNSRRLVYTRDRDGLTQICKVLRIAEICDIGVPIDLPDTPFPAPIIPQGMIPASEVGILLSDAIAGFISFIPPEYLAKSGVYAAFCAYGLLTIMGQAPQTPMDGLFPEQHYWLADRALELTRAQCVAIAQRAQAWYQAHRVAIHAQTVARLLGLAQ